MNDFFTFQVHNFYFRYPRQNDLLLVVELIINVFHREYRLFIIGLKITTKQKY